MNEGWAEFGGGAKPRIADGGSGGIGEAGGGFAGFPVAVRVGAAIEVGVDDVDVGDGTRKILCEEDCSVEIGFGRLG